MPCTPCGSYTRFLPVAIRPPTTPAPGLAAAAKLKATRWRGPSSAGTTRPTAATSSTPSAPQALRSELGCWLQAADIEAEWTEIRRRDLNVLSETKIEQDGRRFLIRGATHASIASIPCCAGARLPQAIRRIETAETPDAVGDRVIRKLSQSSKGKAWRPSCSARNGWCACNPLSYRSFKIESVEDQLESPESVTLVTTEDPEEERGKFDLELPGGRGIKWDL